MEARINSQKNTPKEWILNGKMFRIKTWEIDEPELKDLFDSLIKNDYSMNVIRDKNGILKGITLLYVNNPEDVETIRTTLLVTSTKSELRKTSQMHDTNIKSRTIKTTAPISITKEKFYSEFSKYNSDIGSKYPLIRFHPTYVDRKGKRTKVNIVYIEFSPKSECVYDSFIALSMQHRLTIEKDILIFDRWTDEKPIVKT